jgi:hypothetical protein
MGLASQKLNFRWSEILLVQEFHRKNSLSERVKFSSFKNFYRKIFYQILPEARAFSSRLDGDGTGFRFDWMQNSIRTTLQKV